MPNNKPSQNTKRALIDKADRRMLTFAGIAAFVVVFSIVASKSLISQLGYQNRLAAAKQTALNQLTADLTSEHSLLDSYQAFVSPSTNMIGGSSTTKGAVNSGDNGQIVLDALPSKYDFPAMITSMSDLLNSSGVTVTSISGIDEQLTQQSLQTSPTPQPVPMVFQFTVSGSYQDIQTLFNILQRSTRPIQLQNIGIQASTSTTTNQTVLTLTATAQTFYQPEKVFDITSEVIR
jgi:Tfp pilus assembly protein PilO